MQIPFRKAGRIANSTLGSLAHWLDPSRDWLWKNIFSIFGTKCWGVDLFSWYFRIECWLSLRWDVSCYTLVIRFMVIYVINLAWGRVVRWKEILFMGTRSPLLWTNGRVIRASCTISTSRWLRSQWLLNSSYVTDCRLTIKPFYYIFTRLSIP